MKKRKVLFHPELPPEREESATLKQRASQLVSDLFAAADFHQVEQNSDEANGKKNLSAELEESLKEMRVLSNRLREVDDSEGIIAIVREVREYSEKKIKKHEGIRYFLTFLMSIALISFEAIFFADFPQASEEDALLTSAHVILWALSIASFAMYQPSDLVKHQKIFKEAKAILAKYDSSYPKDNRF